MTSQSSAMSITQLCNPDEQQTSEDQHFIRRLPLVDTALKAYNNPSSVVKYGAEVIESYTSPIYDKLGYSKREEEEEEEMISATTTALANATLNERKSAPTKVTKKPTTVTPSNSRWQQIVLNAGSAAGTTAAVISEESMKCLRYCLSWLQYAIQHIEVQMDLLRSYLVSLATASSSSAGPQQTTLPANNVNQIKKEIIDTLRKVIQVVSQYAGSGLPEQAKQSVRYVILQLPSRWAVVNNNTHAAKGPVHESSINLLDFGGESIDMLKSITVVFSDTIERAELWLKRLKVVSATKD